MVIGSCANTLRHIHKLFADTKTSPALYGQLQLQTVWVHTDHTNSNPESCAGDTEYQAIKTGVALELTAQQLNYQLCIEQQLFEHIFALAAQCHWLVFVDAPKYNCVNSQLLLLVAERLRGMLPKLTGPQFHLVQLRTTPGLWSDFYQALDLNSRWLSMISYRYVFKVSREADDGADQLKELADFLYLLGTSCLPAFALPQLAALQPSDQTLCDSQSYCDHLILPGSIDPATATVHFIPPSAAEFTADCAFLSLSVWPETAYFAQPKLNFSEEHHHSSYSVQVFIEQLPDTLNTSHVLLLQSILPQPKWQLQGYWRLLWMHQVV